MASVFVEYNKNYKGNIETIKSVSSDMINKLKQDGIMRLNKQIAQKLISCGIGKWVSREVGKRREKNCEVKTQNY